MVIVSSEWLTVGQVAERTGLDVQRIRRMVDHQLIGNRDSKTGVRFIRETEIETVRQIAEYMDKTPQATYEQARDFLLKDELLEEHKKQEEVKTHELALQNTILQFMQAQEANQQEVIEKMTEQITDQIVDRIDERVEEKLDQRFATFQEGLLDVLSGVQSGVLEGFRGYQENEQQKTIDEQAEKLQKLSVEIEELRKEKEKEKLIEQQQAVLAEQAATLDKLTRQIEEMKNKPEPPKRKKFLGLF